MIFLIVVAAIWALALGIWWFSSSAFRSADVDRLKARLLGTTKEKKKGSGHGPALINPDQPLPSLLVRLATRFNFEKRLSVMLEQAGSKMTVPRGRETATARCRADLCRKSACNPPGQTNRTRPLPIRRPCHSLGVVVQPRPPC